MKKLTPEHMELKALIKRENKTSFPYYPKLSYITGSMIAGLMLSRIVDLTKDKEDVFITNEQLASDLRVSIHYIRRAKNRLKYMCLVHVTTENGKSLYTVDYTEIMTLVDSNFDSDIDSYSYGHNYYLKDDGKGGMMPSDWTPDPNYLRV